jgi:hypothetical protein
VFSYFTYFTREEMGLAMCSYFFCPATDREATPHPPLDLAALTDDIFSTKQQHQSHLHTPVLSGL